MFHSAVVALILLAGGTEATQQPDNNLVQTLNQCLGMKVDADRLACLEATARQLINAEGRREIVIIDRAEMKKTRRSLFGFSLPNVKLFGTGDRTGSEERDDSLETTIVAARSEKFDRWTVDLAEGGRWQTTEPWAYGPTPRAGVSVKLDRGALGSYSLKTVGARPVRARRID